MKMLYMLYIALCVIYFTSVEIIINKKKAIVKVEFDIILNLMNISTSMIKDIIFMFSCE